MVRSKSQQRRNATPLRPWITTSALGLVAAAGIHLGVAADHGRQAVTAGGFFVAAALLQLLLAAAISMRPSPAVFRATIAANGVLVVLWAAARVAVVPLSGHGGPEAVRVVDGAALLAELAAMAGAFLLLRAAAANAHAGRPRRPRRVLSPALAVAAAAVLGLSIPAAAAASADSDHHEDPAHRAGDDFEATEHEHSGKDEEHSDIGAAHSEQADALLRSLISSFERDGVCASGEPRTSPDCQPGG